MNRPANVSETESLFRQLTEDEDSATVKIFRQLCRRSPALRYWLWEDFSRDEKVREKFAEFLKEDGDLSANGSHWIAELAGDHHSWLEEQRRLQQEMPRAVRPYGGLTWSEMEKLVRFYQAGRIDLGTFLLAHDWRQAGKMAKASAVLTRSAAEFVDMVVNSGQTRLLKHFSKALRFFKKNDSKAKRRAVFGFPAWWKLHVLFYMLRHPQESYRTRELRAHLATLGPQVSTKDMRRFCKRHGIKRDIQAGRPRKRTAVPAAAQAASKRSDGKAS
jgi:hypothetical protein